MTCCLAKIIKPLPFSRTWFLKSSSSFFAICLCVVVYSTQLRLIHSNLNTKILINIMLSLICLRYVLQNEKHAPRKFNNRETLIFIGVGLQVILMPGFPFIYSFIAVFETCHAHIRYGTEAVDLLHFFLASVNTHEPKNIKH